MKRLLLITLLFAGYTHAQDTLNVLFLGNSYTGSNNLPSIVFNLATNGGDHFTYDSSTPGGHTFNGHTTNTTSQSKIKQGGWDFVVLQEQSQIPSFPDGQVATDCFPYAADLNDTIEAYNPCGETCFYMTWGRENGDASNCSVWPPVCTYNGMDSLLRKRYLEMADDNDAIVSPAGAAWRYVRLNNPSIDLYSPDGSHPSQAGSYLTALCFYSVMYRKDPSLLTWDYNLSTTEADYLRNAAKAVAYDSLEFWNVGKYDVTADFNYTTAGNSVDVTNTSLYYDQITWDIDGTAYTSETVSHSFAGPGTYTITLIAERCGKTDTLEQQVMVSGQLNTACDSLTVNCCSIETDGTNTVTLYASNASSDLFDYPGFILLDGNGDTLAVETVNYFGIGTGPQAHVMDIINPINLPITGELHLYSNFYGTLECIIPITFSDSTLSIRERTSRTIQVYPNPSRETITLSEPLDDILIVSMSGQVVRNGIQGSVIDISMLPEGVYTLKATDLEGAPIITRFVKQE